MTVMKRLTLLLATLSLAGAAHGAVLSAASGNAVTDYSDAALVSFDLDLTSFATTRMEFTLEQGDLEAGALQLNALVRNLRGIGLQRLQLRLDGIDFGAPGSVTPTFATLATLSVRPGAVSIGFGAREYAEFYFGNPLFQNGPANWLLDVAGMQVGQRFALSVAIGEPAPLMLMLTAMLLFGCALRGGKKRD